MADSVPLEWHQRRVEIMWPDRLIVVPFDLNRMDALKRWMAGVREPVEHDRNHMAEMGDVVQEQLLDWHALNQPEAAILRIEFGEYLLADADHD